MFKGRIKKLREKLRINDIDAILLIGDVNRNYLSGFTGDESFSLITQDSAIFITDSRYTQQAKIQVRDYKLLEYKGNIYNFILEHVNKLNIQSLGFEENTVSFAQYTELLNILGVKLVMCDKILRELRIVKDNTELESIRKAASIADNAFQHICTFIKAGMTENDISIELEYFIKKNGASGLSFPSIVASGSRSSLPHGEPTDKVIKNGEFLTLDFGCMCRAYCSDMTRTVVIGKADDKMKQIYDVVLTAQLSALEAIKPGKTCSEVDAVARDYIESKGYGEYFGHGLGHGVGREIHEMPYINSKGVNSLKAGMVITDEPGIYIPNYGGVRIEDLVFVTEEGYEVVSKSSKQMICI